MHLQQIDWGRNLKDRHIESISSVHERMAPGLEPDEVQVALQLETLGEDSRERTEERLLGLGYILL